MLYIFLSLLSLSFQALQVPANRVGHNEAGMTAANLRAVAEVAILLAFILFSTFVLKEPLRVNHIVGFFVVCLGVYVVLNGPFPAIVYAPGEDNKVVPFRELEDTDGF